MVVTGLVALANAVPARAADEFTRQRNQMVDELIVGAGIKNPAVVQAIRDTPRHEFVLFKDRRLAYYDMALPIGSGQTISPPFIVAYMTEQLDPQPTDKVLEIGTGSGYQAAVLSPLVDQVYTIEIVDSLGRAADRTLRRLRYRNVHTKIGDGYLGWPEHAPFDKIIVTCSPEKVPEPLVEQLREGGRLIVPLGERYQQKFYLFRKENGELVAEALKQTLFVPMTGQAEARREVLPDPLNPTLHNGSFESLLSDDGQSLPESWHYVRQMEVVADPLSPDGEHYARFSNGERGTLSQALQGFAIDGLKVPALEVSLRVKGQDIRPGLSADELPSFSITYYDDRQEMVGVRMLGPWRGTFEWQPERARLSVPPKAVTGIARIGMLGATGELSVDAIEIRAASR